MLGAPENSSHTRGTIYQKNWTRKGLILFLITSLEKDLYVFVCMQEFVCGFVHL